MTSQLGLWAFVRRAASVLVVGVVALLVALAWAAAPAGAGLAAATHEHGSTPHVDIEEANSPVFGYDHRSDFARPPSAEVETNGYDSSSDLVDPAAEGSSIPRASWGLGADRVAPSRAAVGFADDALPAGLRGGPSDVHVYMGIRDGKPVYTGFTNNLARRQVQHGDRFVLQQVTSDSLTRAQARAIEQALIARNPGLENAINSISPRHSYYQQAVDWGEAWLRANGYG